MDTLSIIGIASIFIGLMISRVINERAMKKLSQEEKANLIDGFASIRVYGILPVIAVIGLYWGLSKFSNFDRLTIFYIYLSMLVLIVIGLQFIVHKKLSSLNFPIDYLKKYHLSRFIYLMGFGGFIATILLK